MAEKILITGADGMLGKDLCPILEKRGFQVIPTNRHNMDITSIKEIEMVFNKHNPDIVIHCAAYTNVNEAENDREKTREINIIGTQNTAKMSQLFRSHLIYISTDYVFDGNRNYPYLSTDKPNPINYYGLTKYRGEIAVKEYCDRYSIVRTSWLYGVHGKNFAETMISLSKKGEIRVVNDQFGCPTWTVDLSNGIVDIINSKKYNGIHHICGKGVTTWFEFAKEIFKQLNIDINVIPCYDSEYQSDAKRPKYSAMADKDYVGRDWKEALKLYLAERGKH